MEKLIAVFLLLMTGTALLYLVVSKVFMPIVNMLKQSARLK